MQHGRGVHVPNQGSGERGTSAAGSGDGREGNEEPVKRVAVIGEWEAGKVGRAWRTMRHRTLGAAFIVCNEFLFLKKNDDDDVSRPIVVGLSVS